MFKFIEELKELDKLSKDGSISRGELADRMDKVELPAFLALISKYFITFEIFMMWSLPTIIVIQLFEKIRILQGFLSIILMGMIPFLFIILFIMVGALFASIGKVGIIEGKFPRSYKHPIYALRRIYGTAWAQIYYFKPIYAVCLAVPTFKKILFRAFGFKGDVTFVTYPDSWIRDLPLLEIGKNVYLANRCVIGTNLCLNDSSIMVGKCIFDDNSMVGHLAIFGLGCKIGKHSELGVNSGLGIRVQIGDRSSIGPTALVYHGTEIGQSVKIGAAAVIGIKCKIADGIEIKSGAIIPSGSTVLNQKEADETYAAESRNLVQMKDNILKVLVEHLNNETLSEST